MGREAILKKIDATLNVVIGVCRKARGVRYLLDRVNSNSMDYRIGVEHSGIRMELSAPNALCHWRAETFSTKEPETLEWIDSFRDDSVFWDVGANVGLYSVYAALKKHCKVWAFEPSVFNLEVLARNISLNSIAERVCIVPIALNHASGDSLLRLTTTKWGGALSTFDKEFGWDANPIQSVFEFRTLGITMDDAADKLKISMPDYLKIDVDGLEHFILKGGSKVLKNIREILIEINDDFRIQEKECRRILSGSGMEIKEKRHSDYIAKNTRGFQNTYNQIWQRKI